LTVRNRGAAPSFNVLSPPADFSKRFHLNKKNHDEILFILFMELFTYLHSSFQKYYKYFLPEGTFSFYCSETLKGSIYSA
jgi:hypothetical protein